MSANLPVRHHGGGRHLFQLLKEYWPDAGHNVFMRSTYLTGLSTRGKMRSRHVLVGSSTGTAQSVRIPHGLYCFWTHGRLEV